MSQQKSGFSFTEKPLFLGMGLVKRLD